MRNSQLIPNQLHLHLKIMRVPLKLNSTSYLNKNQKMTNINLRLENKQHAAYMKALISYQKIIIKQTKCIQHQLTFYKMIRLINLYYQILENAYNIQRRMMNKKKNTKLYQKIDFLNYQQKMLIGEYLINISKRYMNLHIFLILKLFLIS